MKIIAIAAAVVGALVMLAACGGGTGGPLQPVVAQSFKKGLEALLRQSDPAAYLQRVRESRGDKAWMEALREIDPEQHQAEIARRAAEEEREKAARAAAKERKEAERAKRENAEAAPVATAPPTLELQPVEAVHVTVRAANVRAAATIESSKVATLPAGTEVYVPGRTADGKWLKVERDGTPLGFIYAPLLRDKAVVEEKAAAADHRRQARHVGETFKDCPDCPRMVVVPSGSFMMGSPESDKKWRDDEKPRHRVRIPAPFAVGRFEVTFSEWDACVSDGGCGGYRPKDRDWGRDRRPVIYVSWNDAKRYVSWLSKKTGRGYRLLSEAEWEYVARAGTTTRYHWGDDYRSDRVADGGKTELVGRYASNRFGLHDVHGNVFEWVEDCWNGSYAGAPDDGRPWVSGTCGIRVARGGSWDHPPGYLRAAYRSWSRADFRNADIGFRVARIF